MVLATILEVRGSSPRQAGTKMLLAQHAGRFGTIGGGQNEARTLEACRKSLEDGCPALLETKMLGAGTASPEMICGGTQRMLIEPLSDVEPYRLALARLAAGERVVFVKRFVAGDAPSVAVALIDRHGDALHGQVDAPTRQQAMRALEHGAPCFDRETTTYYEPVSAEEKLLILGGGHVGRALAVAASALDFQVTVVDDRPGVIAEANLPPKVRTLIADYDRAIAEFPFDASTYAVIVTRGHHLDLVCLRALLTREYRYAGLMGSLRKSRLLIDEVRNEGFDPARVEALCAPIGLDIGAETPEELAVAILSEIIAFRRSARILPPLKQARKARWTAS